MAVYTVNGNNPVGAAWVTLPTPGAAAWLQGRGDLLVTTRSTPDENRALRVKRDIPFPVRTGSAGVQIRSASGTPVRVVFEDQP